MKLIVKWALSIFALAVISSCASTYYNASVLGHESIETPLVKDGTHEVHVKVGGAVRGIQANSMFTEDFMRAIQFSWLADATFPITKDSVAIDLNGGISWYDASTSVALVRNDRESYSGYGLSFQARPGFLMKLGETVNGMLYWKSIYDREYGAYKDFRSNSLLNFSATSGAINESPSGSTLSNYLGGQLQFLLSSAFSLDLGGEIGTLYSEWPGSNGQAQKISEFNLFGVVSFYNFWVYATLEDLAFLNSGIAIGAGYYLF